MKKAIGYCRRFLASLMICFTLSFTALGGYLGVGSIPVQATGVIELEALAFLIEAIMSSMGMTFSSEADLNNAAAGLHSITTAYPDFQYGGVSIFDCLMAENVEKTGYMLTVETYNWLKSYCYNLASDRVSSASDVVSPFTSLDGSITCQRIGFSNYSADELISLICMNSTPYYVDSSTNEKIEISANEDMLNARYIVTQLISYEDCCDFNIYYVLGDCNYPIVFDGDGGSYIRYKGEVKNGYSTVFSSYDTGLVVAYDSNYFAPNFTYRSHFIYEFTNSFFRVPYDYIDKDTLSVYGYHDSDTKASDEPYSAVPLTCEGLVTNVYFNTDYKTPIYSSYDEFAISSYASIYAPASKVYGLSSTAKDYETDATTGQVTIPYFEPYITSQVSSAIANALAANPALTEAELNAVATDIVAAQNGTTDAVNQNTATLSTLLTSILAQVRSIADSVSKISMDGGSAALDWTDVQEMFGTTTTVPDTSGDNESDNDDDNTGGVPSIWVPTALTGVALLLKPLIEFLGQPLSVITQFQSAILDTLSGAEEWIMDIPESIATALAPALADIQDCILSFPLEGIYEGVLALPGDIADALSDGLVIDVGDVAVGDYTSALDRVIELLENLFVIDTGALAAALSGFDTIWETKMPFGNEILALFNAFNFSDNYNYPVIKIQTPDILKTFYMDDYIILCDFENYKVQVLWARNIVKAWLWFCFGLSIFNHLKTNLHIG